MVYSAYISSQIHELFGFRGICDTVYPRLVLVLHKYGIPGLKFTKFGLICSILDFILADMLTVIIIAIYGIDYFKMLYLQCY